MAEKTWFITGTSRGFGREWTSAALRRGDRVAATARDPGTLDDLAAGIHVTLIEPGGFATDWGGSSARHAEPHDAYAGVHEPPLRAFFGSRPLGIAEKHYERRLATWRQWQPVAEIAQGNGP